jgi:hypothetical protein
MLTLTPDSLIQCKEARTDGVRWQTYSLLVWSPVLLPFPSLIAMANTEC